MDFFSHFLLGILISVYFFGSYGSEYVLYAGLLAIFADFDVFLEFFRRIRRSNLLKHKGISHSFFTALIVSAITSIFFSLITGNDFLFSWIFGAFFYSLHVIFDGLAASKIPLFYPFTKKRYRFFIDRAINPLLATISGGILLFYLITYYLMPSVFYSNIIDYFSIFYLIYFSYRILSKIVIQTRLFKNQKYVPGILPLTYFIYENNRSNSNLSFKLFKKKQFRSKKELLLASEIQIGSEEFEYFNKAKKISENYIFFSKWENIFPIIWKDKTYIIILFFLAESYASGTAYSLQTIFNMATGELVHKIDGFGHIMEKSKKDY